MRYKWDGFMGRDVETAYLGQDYPSSYSLVPEPELPSGAFASDVTQSVVLTNVFDPTTQPPISIAIPDLTTPAWPPPSPWPIVPEAPNPSIAESQRVYLPAPTPSPTGPNNAGIFADVAAGISKILAPITSTALPLLERYGVVRPVRGPSRLPLPGEPGYLYASSVYGRGALPSFQTAAPWLLGGGVVLALMMAGRRRR